MQLHPLADLGAVLDALERLIGRELAVRLSRRPGQKEERYAQLLGEDARRGGTGRPAARRSRRRPAAESRAAARRPGADAPSPAAPTAPAAPDPRVTRLEEEVAALRADLGALRASLDALREELGPNALVSHHALRSCGACRAHRPVTRTPLVS